MGNVSNGGNSPEKLFGVKVNSSDLGKPVTWGMGCFKTNQLVFWEDGFTATAESTGGKKGNGGGGGGGKGGGKGGSENLYSVNLLAGLGAGPITGIGSVWSGQSWLGSPTANECYTIAGPSYTYTPKNATALINNYGVTPASTYSAAYNDYSAPGSTMVSNTTSIPFQQVPYGDTLTSGTYSVNPSTGVYNFSSANAGQAVQLAYSYLVTEINQQENDIVPAGLTIQVGGNFAFEADLGVVYAGSGPNNGQALDCVNGTPTAAGQYSVSGSAPATYQFFSADIGAEVTITFQISNPNAVGQNESTMLDFTLATGNIGQAPYSFLSSSYPGAALGYSGVATILYEPMDLGMGGEPQENSFEVITPDIIGGVYANGSPILDCNPVHNIYRVLTDTAQGLGVGTIPFPAAFIDNGPGGTWGAPGTPSVQSVGSSAWNWFAANNFLISPVLDSQDTADSTMSKWLEAGMCASFVSEGLLKLVPYGDTTVAANGCTWTAPSTYVAALDDTCFVAKEGVDPVSIKRSAWQDAFNVVQVQWDNRNNQYAKEITEESDQSLINRYGTRIEDPQDWGFIHSLMAATFAANMRLKHGTYIRNTYEFTLPFNYSYLEAMDLVTLTTSSVWAQGVSNTNLGVTNLPVRITKIVDDPTEGLKIEAEDYPFGAGCVTLFNKGQSAAEVVSDAYASPGTSEVVLFEATGRLTGYKGNQLWIGACGTGENYGSTNVWVSQDNVNYVQAAQLTTPSVIGALATTFPVTADPDTTSNLVVQLAENCPPLTSGTQAAADNDTMLCYVDGEVISYSACSVTGQNNTYTMGSYIRRGQLGTAIASHAVHSLFMRLDGSIFKYTYDPTWQGKTIYLKFQAVNNFGNNPQPLSNLTPVSFTLSSTNSGAVDASTGYVQNLGGVTSSSITPIANLMPAEADANVTETRVSLQASNLNNHTLDHLVDGTSRFGVAAVDSNKRAIIDFAQSHFNKTAANIPYASGGSLESLKPAQAGADVTSSHTAAAITGQGALATLSSASLDTQVTDGATYQRMPIANMDSNRRGLVDFTQAGHIGKSMDNVPDGSNRHGVTAVDSNGKALIDFSQSHSNKSIDYISEGSTNKFFNGKTLDNLPDGGSRFGVASVDTNHRALVDFSQSHFNKTANNIPYASGASLESLKPAQAGADVTASNTSANALQLGGTSAASIIPIANLMPSQAGADKTSSNTAADTAKVNGVGSSLISPISSLMPAQAGADVTSQHTSNDTANVSGNASATVAQGATGVNKNLVPDSDFKFQQTYWTAGGAKPWVILPGAGYNASNLVYCPTGTDGSRQQFSSGTFPVVPGQTYTLSCWIDATYVNPSTNVLVWVSFNGQYPSCAGSPGSSGRTSATFTVPAGITSLSMVIDQFTATLNTAKSNPPYLFAVSAPMIQVGSTMTAYQPNFIDDSTGSIAHGAMSSQVRSVVNSSSQIVGATAVQGTSYGAISLATMHDRVSSTVYGPSQLWGGSTISGTSTGTIAINDLHDRVHNTLNSGSGVNFGASGHTGTLPYVNHAPSITNTVLSAGGIDFSSALHQNKTMAYISDGGGRYAAAESGANVTKNHILTAVASLSGVVTVLHNTNTPKPWTDLTGLGFSATTSSSADVYNIEAVIALSQAQSGAATTWMIGLIVDGNYTTPSMNQAVTVQLPSAPSVPFFASVTGLSAGSHTFQISIQSVATIDLTVQNTGTYAICQRIY